MSAAMFQTDTPDLTIPVVKRDRANDRVTFTLDDDPTILFANRPKQATLFGLVKGLGNLDKVDDFVASAALVEMLYLVLEPDSKAYLEARFADDADDCDLDVAEPIIKSLVGLWYDRPTGKPGASSGSWRETGKPSTEGSPSVARTP